MKCPHESGWNKTNCGNQVAENGRKKKEKPIVATKLLKLWGKKFNSNLGNEIVENEGEKRDDLGWKLKGKKKFVAMELLKWEGKKIVVIDL